ncbi:hypothetical protein NVP1223O_56 [Vibrio phage 1.223.O._10N.261.48.A9]|nr:hypothetical protein NVP1223O_56 [Vibrio phage 1.223.O._10N.261.48.A9]
MNISMKNGKVTIDGKSFTGSNISINNNKVIVDGVTQDGELIGDVNVVVHGDVDRLENTSGTIKAGNVGHVKTVSGDVDCCDVSGNVQTVSGDVKCGNISGSVKTVSGDVK